MRRLLGTLVGLLVALSSGCYSYSNFQSAKLLDPRRGSLTPSASYNTFQEAEGGNASEIDDWVFDVQARHGVSRSFEMGAKFSRIRIEDGYQFMALEPKIALEPDRLALACAVGSFFGNDVEANLQVHPTLIATVPLEPGRSELDAAVKALVFFDEGDTDTLIGFNLGPRFSSDLDLWAIHPEIGILINPGEDGFFFQFGVGFMVSP
jgi:hypothetical protein